MVNERLDKALEWAKNRRIGSKQLNIFDRLYRSKRRKQDKANLKPGGNKARDKAIKGTEHKGV